MTRAQVTALILCHPAGPTVLAFAAGGMISAAETVIQGHRSGLGVSDADYAAYSSHLSVEDLPGVQ